MLEYVGVDRGSREDGEYARINTGEGIFTLFEIILCDR